MWTLNMAEKSPRIVELMKSVEVFFSTTEHEPDAKQDPLHSTKQGLLRRN